MDSSESLLSSIQLHCVLTWLAGRRERRKREKEGGERNRGRGSLMSLFIKAVIPLQKVPTSCPVVVVQALSCV